LPLSTGDASRNIDLLRKALIVRLLHIAYSPATRNERTRIMPFAAQWTDRARCAALALLVLFFAACQPGPPDDGAWPIEPTVILISIDGFRWDYLDRYDAPELTRLAANGIRAEGLIPVFPTKTFPNHYSIVTGLYPQNHGIISNTMYDPDMDEGFSLRDRDAMENPRWWEGEPVWVTAENQGVKTATYFWPGSDVAIHGTRPTYWHPYDGRVPNEDRVDQVLAWLDEPIENRPRFITLYFSEVDSRGHRYGPDAPETAEAVARADALIGRLVDGLESRALFQHVNLVITSDHGMVETSPERVIFVDDYLNLADVHVVDWSPVLMIRPLHIEADSAFAALSEAHPHLRVYRREDVPTRLHFSDHPRITDIVALADEGWSISSRAFEGDPNRFRGGAHGYDNRYQSMQGLFIAHGPAFRSGLVVAPFESVHIYPILVRILGLEPPPHDANIGKVELMLAPQAEPGA
jgi:predicted AlkP superfamily pyrophosphatase or phosphodiesterase